MPPRGGGKEELRASLLKPYLLRLRSIRDDSAVRALLASAGISASVLDDETAWISVAAARRALGGLSLALGEGALTRRDTWLTHPENLGGYVRLFRAAASPLDGDRFIANNPEQTSRVGAFQLEELSPLSVRMSYRPRDEEDDLQMDRLFCDAREGELASLPRFWGLPDAEVTQETCLAKGDPNCSYVV